jgi:hypothetical protein
MVRVRPRSSCLDHSDGEGAPWRAQFGKALAGTDAFTKVWKTIAGKEPAAFGEAQHAFIERTHYRPAVAQVLGNARFNLDQRCDAVRDACWSVAVQHGRAGDILTRAVRSAFFDQGGTIRPSIASSSARSTPSATATFGGSRGPGRRTSARPCSASATRDTGRAQALIGDAQPVSSAVSLGVCKIRRARGAIARTSRFGSPSFGSFAFLILCLRSVRISPHAG